LLLLPVNSWAVNTVYFTANKTGEDYGGPSAWEGAMDGAGAANYTSGGDGIVCGEWDTCTGGTCNSANLTDGEAVTWDSGASSGTLFHISNNNGNIGGSNKDYYVIDVTSGTLDNDDSVTDGTNTFQVNGNADSCILYLEMFDDDGEHSGTADISFVTDATNYFVITAPAGERHSGPPMSDGSSGNGFRGQTVNRDEYINCGNNYGIVEWLQVEAVADASSDRNAIQACAIVRYNIIEGDEESGTQGIGLTGTFSGTYYIHNNIIYDMPINDNEGIVLENSSSGTVYIWNNTLVDNVGQGYNAKANANDPVIHLANNLADGNGTDYAEGEASTSTSTNISSDTSSPDGASYQSKNPTYVNEASNDFHLADGSDGEDAGTDLGTTQGVNIDIDGTNRDAGTYDPWDCGAHEETTVAGGGSTVSELIINIM